MSNSNPMPIYSHVVPKSQQYRSSSKTKNGTRERNSNLPRDFDPLNYNNGGQFIGETKEQKERRREEKEVRKKEDAKAKRTSVKNDSSEGKVEAYLRQNQVSIRQQQHRHSAVRQAEHRVNLRSLPLNDVAAPRTHDRTPDRHRAFPEREREATTERRRERNKERDNFDGAQPSPTRATRPERDSTRPVRKSSSSHKVSEATLCTANRRFFCREWLFQKIAHCLEQRSGSKTCGTLILGEAGSGKTAICRELSEPGQGAQGRQQRALNRRMLARHFLQANAESSKRPGEFIRSLAMQILSHSDQHKHRNKSAEDSSKSPDNERARRITDVENLVRRFKDLANDGDGEDSSKPLLADSEDQRTDEEGDMSALPWQRRTRTINRIHESKDYMDCLADAEVSRVDELPEILPRNSITTNPFLSDEHQKDSENRVYENHENLFLRNVSQKPQIDKKTGLPKTAEQKTDSETDKSEKTSRIESSPPKSRIPVSKFKSPYKTDITAKTSSNESSPQKKNLNIDSSSNDTSNIDSKIENIDSQLDTSNGNVVVDELPEYQNVLKEEERRDVCDMEMLVDKKRMESDDVPPPIPSLPVSPRTLIANAYYEKLLSDPEIQQALLPQNLEKNPDECFKRAILFPLLEIDPPKQSLFWLIDAIDEGFHGQTKAEKNDSTKPAASVCVLIARHQHLLPQWLLLLPTARSHSKQITHMFTGCRKIVLDDLQRAHVSADVQRYVLARLDTEPKLRSRVSSDSAAAAAAAAALDHLRIKSDGCMLYLEKVLDGVADGFIVLREIKEIPGTLNGLYLWLAQRLFHGRRFTKVRLLLDVLLAARCGVTEEMLYKCLLTKECNVTRDDFNRRLHLLRRILVIDPTTSYLSIFHHSFSKWLVDVKHCTRRYLCSPGDGHGALAMYYTLDAHRLSPLEIHNYVLHITSLEEHLQSQKKSKNSKEPEILDIHTLILLWVLDSGCDVASALKRDSQFDGALVQINEADEKVSEDILEAKAPDAAQNASPLNTIMPELITGWTDGEWPRDNQVLEALLQLTKTSENIDENELKSETQEEDITTMEDTTEEISDSVSVDPTLVYELASKGEDDALVAIIKRHPALLESQDGTGGTALHCAARAGKPSTALVLLNAGADINAKDADGWTPLRAAAWAGHTEVVDVLLEHGCEVDCVDADNRTALRAAAWSGHESVVSRLLAAGADPNKADGEGRTALIAAAYMCHVTIVESLLHYGAHTEHADNDGRTALSVAALSSSGLACITVLIDHGANVNVPDKDGATPLIVAAFEGHTAICEALLEAGAEVEVECTSTSSGRGALWAAAAASHAAVARLLLYWGARVDHMDEDGRTVLAVAAAHGNSEVVRQLLDRGLDENHRDNSGWTPLHYAAFEGHVEVCAALLEAGARIDEVENDGKSAAMVAAGEGHCEVISLLAEWGADLNRAAHDATTAARLAALEGHIPCVRLLHSLGCDVDVMDAEQRSTLYVLALDNRLEMAEFIIRECGAKVTTRDTEGRTPLHVAAWQGHAEMIELLITVGGASVASRDRCGRTALHCAAWRGRDAALEALVRHAADTRAQCTQGASPLGIAAQEGHEECVLLLLQHGADPLQADHCGRTPAKVAWRAGHVNICRVLESRAAPSAPTAPTAPLADHQAHSLLNNSPDYKRRSVHSSNSTKCSSNLTGGSNRSHDKDHTDLLPNRSNLSLSFVQQVARCGRGRRDKDKVIPERRVIEQDDKLRSYMGAEGDSALQGSCSPLYVSPPRSPVDPEMFVQNSQLSMQDMHFNRDTHMRIILGREAKQPTPKNDTSARSVGSYKRLVGTLKRARGRILKQSKSKRNGIVTNPALRLVANVKNGLDHAAANIRRTGVALAASASSNNPAVKTNAFQWRKETPL